MRAFVWRDDEAGNRLAEAILRAAERGVDVTIRKDRIAAVYELSGGNKQSFFHKQLAPTERFQAWFLRAVYMKPSVNGVQRPNPVAEAILKHPRIHVESGRKRFDHSKLFIIDERRLILGSMGIGDNHHAEWVEMMVELEGEEHVARLRQRLAGKVSFDAERDIDFLCHSRDAAPRKVCDMLDHRLALIDAAQQSLTIEMAYLGDPRFTAALVRAVKRGVDVLLHTSKSDVLGDLNLATCNALRRRTGAPDNLTIVLHPHMVHTKAVVVDSQISDVGSANFTPLSHGVYDEINLFARSIEFARRLEAAIQDECADGQVVTGRVRVRPLRSAVERVIVAYQARHGR